MITERDTKILKFINIFGKTFDKVLANTFFTNESTQRKRIAKLKEMDLVNFWKTGLLNPRRAIVLTEQSKQYLENEFEIKAKNPKIAITTINHLIIEQLSYFYLSQVGNIFRTTVYSHSKKLHHIPDFILESNNLKINIEVELTKKSVNRYKQILLQTQKDDVDAILYIVKKSIDIERFKSHLPTDNRLMFIDIETLILNIKNTGKINPIQ